MIFQELMIVLNLLMCIGVQIVEVFEVYGRLILFERVVCVLYLLCEVGILDFERVQYVYLFQFLGGQRQCVVIVMVLVLELKVLIVDELMIVLDVIMQVQIFKLIRELQDWYSMVVMFVIYDFGVVVEIVDDVVVIEFGELVEQGLVLKVLVDFDYFYICCLIDVILMVVFNVGQMWEQFILWVCDLVKEFCIGDCVVRVSDNVMVDLMWGEILGIVGEFGLGKFMLGWVIVQLMQFDGGSIQMDGNDIFKLCGVVLKVYCKWIQMIFQDLYVLLNLCVWIGCILIEGLMVYGKNCVDVIVCVCELLLLVGLKESVMDCFLYEFLGGQW